MTSSHTAPAPCNWFWELAWALDRRSGARLVRLFLGTLLARGRRTAWTSGPGGPPKRCGGGLARSMWPSI